MNITIFTPGRGIFDWNDIDYLQTYIFGKKGFRFDFDGRWSIFNYSQKN